MKKIDAYKADNGLLETDPMRAIAHDIAHTFERRAKSKAVGTSATGTSKIDWHAAMELLENIDLLMPHLQEWRDILTPPAVRREPPRGRLQG